MDKKLLKTREEIYKKCPGIFWEVSIFCILVGIALVALDTVIPGTSYITFALIFFPLLYATYMTLYSIKFGGTVTVKSTFAISATYFKRSNFGCFRLLRCLFHAILVDVIASTVLMVVLSSIFTAIYGSAYTDSIQHILDLYSASELEALANYLSADNLGSLYFDCCSAFAYSIAIIAFIFGVAFNSTNAYLCANIPEGTAPFSTAVFKTFLKKNIKSYRKDFWSLNWPLFALLVAGIAGAYALTLGLDISLKYALPISSMVGIAFLIPFAPFFFAGMEALFAKYNEEMRKASMELTNGFLIDLKNNVNISEEDRAKIDELLSKKMNNDDKNDSQEK